ncbi:MAG: hypothetical protein GY845_23565 [Planctomycetes bacterium]|nr:hypothetical protein [Planctomycetota bacterium]
MNKNVTFEGKIRVEGSIQTVERVLARLAREKAVMIDHDLIPDPWDRGKPRPPELLAIITSKFVSKNIALIKKKAGKNARLSIGQRIRDWGIHGGRKYCHVHFDNYILPVDNFVYNQLFLNALNELNSLGVPNEIPR